jgi:hypothetical protein
MHRRKFMQLGLAGGLSSWAVNSFDMASCRADDSRSANHLKYDIVRQVPTRLFDGKRCWCHPRAGIVPGAGKDGLPRVVMTMNILNVSGSDVFQGMFSLHTDDLGKTWTEPEVVPSLAPTEEVIDGEKRPVALSDFWPTWHEKTGKLLGTGHTVVYTPDWKVVPKRPRQTAYSVYDASSHRWATWKKLEMPESDKFDHSGAGCVQRDDKPDGTILLPISFRPPGKNSRVTVTRCRFDGQTLTYEGHGEELSIDDETRGLGEPSLTCFQGEYFLTLRNDRRGFVTRSRDGMNFEPIQEWKFDDGEKLGNYNTQQHWVTHPVGLFLVYTRRGVDNDHVFRHRAPLLMAQVDPKKLRVLRETERILVPERGARLGNFGVTKVNDSETWVTVAEWMQTWGPNHVLPVDNPYGSDGSVFVARIRWKS